MHHGCCPRREESGYSDIRENSKLLDLYFSFAIAVSSGKKTSLLRLRNHLYGLQVTLSGGILFVIFGIQSFLSTVES